MTKPTLKVFGKLLISLALLLTAIRIPFIGFSLLCLGLASRLPGKLSYIEKVLLSFLAMAVANAFLYEFFSALRFYPDIQILGFLYAVLGFIVVLRFPSQEYSGFASKRIYLSLAVALITFAYLMYPVFANSRIMGGHSIAALHLLTTGEDNASHYSLFKYAYQHNGYAYSGTANSTGLLQSLINYPQGSEFSMAWFAKSILGASFRASDSVLIEMYYTLCVLVYSLVISFSLLLALALFKKKIKPAHATISLLLTIFLLAFGPALALLAWGFQSQIAAYIYLLALIYALSIPEAGKAKARLTFALLMFGGICIAWWFLAPVGVLPILLFLWQRKKLAREVLTSKTYLSLLGIIIIFSAYPTLLSIILSPGAASVNARGGIYTIAATTMLAYIFGCLAALVYQRKLAQDISILQISLMSWGIFTIAVGLYQRVTLGHIAYYYLKSLYTLLPLAVVAIVLLCLYLTEKMITGLSKLQGAVILSVLIALSINYAISVRTKPTFIRAYTQNQLVSAISPDSLSVLFHQSSLHDDDVVYVGGCSAASTYINNRWSGAFFQTNETWHDNVITASLRGNNGMIASLLSNPPSDKNKIFVYAEKSCLDARVADIIKSKGYPSTL